MLIYKEPLCFLDFKQKKINAIVSTRQRAHRRAYVLIKVLAYALDVPISNSSHSLRSMWRLNSIGLALDWMTPCTRVGFKREMGEYYREDGNYQDALSELIADLGYWPDDTYADNKVINGNFRTKALTDQEQAIVLEWMDRHQAAEEKALFRDTVTGKVTIWSAIILISALATYVISLRI